MDDGRETSVQSYIFLILTCHSFENDPLSIRQSILYIKTLYSSSLKKSIRLKDFYILSKIEKGQNSSIFALRSKD